MSTGAKILETRAKDVLPNTHRTQGRRNRRNHTQQRQNGPVVHSVTSFAASTFHSVAVWGGSEKRVFVPGDLDL